MHFLVDKLGWTPQRVFDVFISEEGFESAVIAKGLNPEQPDGAAFRDYHLYPTGSMNALMRSFDRDWQPFQKERRIGGVRGGP